MQKLSFMARTKAANLLMIIVTPIIVNQNFQNFATQQLKVNLINGVAKQITWGQAVVSPKRLTFQLNL